MKKIVSLTFLVTCFIACTSTESVLQTDRTSTINGRSGDNGTGTDTTSTIEQKAVRESGNILHKH